MIMNELDQIIRENFDLSDKYTRQYIATLEESGQEQLIAALSSALYDKIVAKVDEIDFGSIPQSRGDITRVQGFVNTEQCIDIIRKLIIQYNQNPGIVDSIITAITNIKDRKSVFTKAFNIKADMSMMIYNLMVLAIERSVSLIIATCIQYVKDPNSTTVKIALDKVAYEKTMDDLLFKQLVTFNTLCKTGAMDKTINASMKPSKVHEEVDVVGTILGPNGNDDNETSGINPFTDDVEPFGHSETNPLDPKDKYDLFDPENKPEINPHDLPVPEENPSSEDFPEEKHDEEGNLLTDKPIECPAKEEIPPFVCRMVRMMGTVAPAPAEPTPAAAEDSVEPENIPAVVNDVDDDGVIDEPITEDELSEGVVSDVLGTIGKGAIEKVKKTNPKDFLQKHKKIIGAAAIIGGLIAVPVALVKVVIPFIRNMVYYFYYTKLKVSDYLEVQAELIEANANELENSSDSDMTEEKKAKVVEKQRKWADRLRKWSNMFAIDHKQATNNAKKEAEKDSKEKRTVAKDEDGDDSIF